MNSIHEFIIFLVFIKKSIHIILAIHDINVQNYLFNSGSCRFAAHNFDKSNFSSCAIWLPSERFLESFFSFPF